MKSVQRLFQKLLPFIILGIGLVALAFGLILLAYLFIFGAIIGSILFLISWIRDKFFHSKSLPTKPKGKSRRTIDSDDWDRL